METRCYVCESPHALAACRICDKLVCPEHRVGLGSLSDGYTCLGSNCPLFGFVRVITPANSQPKTRSWYAKTQSWYWDRGDVILALVVIALLGAVVILGRVGFL